MRRIIPHDPHSSDNFDSADRDNSSDLPIETLRQIARSEREKLRARLLEFIERNERARRQRHRWITS